MLDEEPHQPLGVEDELIPAGLLVPAEQRVSRVAEETEWTCGTTTTTCRYTSQRVPIRSPNDGVQASDLRGALQHAERPGQGVCLWGRGQDCPGRGGGGDRERFDWALNPPVLPSLFQTDYEVKGSKEDLKMAASGLLIKLVKVTHNRQTDRGVEMDQSTAEWVILAYVPVPYTELTLHGETQ